VGLQKTIRALVSKEIDRRLPWYESAVFWGAGSIGVSCIIVVATMDRDVLWLLFVAWAFLGLAAWSVWQHACNFTPWKLAVSCAIIGAPLVCWYLYGPRPSMPLDVTIMFKADPIFTPKRRHLISAEASNLYRYLSAFGIEPPKVLSSLGSRPNKSGFAGMIVECPIGGVGQDWFIGETGIDKPECIRQMYGVYSFLVILRVCDPIAQEFEERSAYILGDYYSASFGAKVKCRSDRADTMAWEEGLWEIRQKYGHNLIDAALSYGLAEFHPSAGGERSFNRYFSDRLLYGLHRADNMYLHVADVAKILERRGLCCK